MPVSGNSSFVSIIDIVIGGSAVVIVYALPIDAIAACQFPTGVRVNKYYVFICAVTSSCHIQVCKCDDTNVISEGWVAVVHVSLPCIISNKQNEVALIWGCKGQA